MENRGPGGSQENDSKSAETTRWRRGVDAITDWWLEHFGDPEEEDSEEDQPEPARRRRKASRFFGSSVVGKLFGRREAEQAPEDNEAELVPIRTLLPLNIDMLPASEPAYVEMTPEDTLQNRSDEAFRGAEMPTEPEISDEVEPQPELPDEYIESPNPALPQEAPSYHLQPNIETHATAKETAQPPKVANNIGPALVSGIIVDQMSRHRDRKLRKEAEHLRQELETAKKQQKETTFGLSETVHRQERQERQVEELKSQPAEHVVYTETTEVVGVPTERESAPIEFRTETEQGKIAESQSIRQREAKQPEIIRAVGEGLVENMDAQIVLEQTEVAAEHNIPVESYYERRHEAKDEPNKPGVATGFGAVGRTPDHEAINLHQHPFLDGQQTPGGHTRGESDRRFEAVAMYKKAVVSGLVTGAVIIAALVAYLVLG